MLVSPKSKNVADTESVKNYVTQYQGSFMTNHHETCSLKMYEDMMATIQFDGSTYDLCEYKNGVNQDCVLAHILFLTALLKCTFTDVSDDEFIRTYLADSLFNLL